VIKGVIHAPLGPIWYHSEPSDVTYSPNQFLGWDFFCHFLQQDSSSWVKFKQRMILYISSICNTDFALRIVSLSSGTQLDKDLLLQVAYKPRFTLGGTNMVGKWEPLFTCLKNSSNNNVKVA
jgi:hypothetical protein